MAKKAEQVGVAKAGLDAATTFALAVLAGAFIAVGAVCDEHARRQLDLLTASPGCSVG
jgi:formate/nitrite transporter FocA (FNT family)